MSDRPQGSGWWQASDLKWYPPEQHANHVAPSSPAAGPASGTSSAAGLGAPKRWLTGAGIALVVVIAVVVVGRVFLGTFVPGLLLVVAVAVVGIALAVRSGQSVARKAVFVSVAVLVVAVGIPAGLKVVYPAYHHFFDDGTSQAGRPAGSPGSAPSPRLPSGILTLDNVNSTGKRTYGIIDPTSGTYSEVATFNPAQSSGNGNETVMPPQTLAASPDLTKLAVTTSVRGQSVVGWIDTSGKLTTITPTAAGGSGDGQQSPTSIGFDGNGNFYYWTGQWHSVDQHDADIYEVPAGSTTNARKIRSQAGEDEYKWGWLDYDGSMRFGCDPLRGPNQVVSWLGPNTIVFPYAHAVSKTEVTGRDQKGCLKLGQEIPITSGGFFIGSAVASSDGTKIAFTSEGSLLIAAADGSAQPTTLNLPNLAAGKLKSMVLLKWT